MIASAEAAMPIGPVDPKEFGYYVTLSQAGIEMVVPMALGIVADYLLGWPAWGVVLILGGAILGFVGGFLHLLHLLKQREGDGSSPSDGKTT
jgi:hypothetical protein